jgi:hypothetical protein
MGTFKGWCACQKASGLARGLMSSQIRCSLSKDHAIQTKDSKYNQSSHVFSNIHSSIYTKGNATQAKNFKSNKATDLCSNTYGSMRKDFSLTKESLIISA